MTNTVPIRASIDKSSRFYKSPEVTQRLRIFFNDIEIKDCKEYDIDKQWILIYAKNAKGNYYKASPFTSEYAVIRKHGKVEVTWK